MPQTPEAQSNKETESTAPQLMPNFGVRQWILVGLLCAAGLWLVISRHQISNPEFESVSMVSAKADYYLEAFTLVSTKPNGDAEFTLKAETLIHLPTEALARVTNPILTVNSDERKKTDWELTAASGLLPDDGQSVSLINGVQLMQLTQGQTPVRLITPNLLLDRRQMLLSSDTGVSVKGPGWQLQADKMTGEIETGKLTFRDNSHAQYNTQQTN
ncbi:MAG: LPS export ABC transporter periplasmic protein LptC [Granulosicoccaceae bacterium]